MLLLSIVIPLISCVSSKITDSYPEEEMEGEREETGEEVESDV